MKFKSLYAAQWTFVFWGLLHGLGLVAVRWWQSKRWLVLKDTAWARGMCVLLTFHFVCLTWVFFRAETVGQAFAVLRQLGRFSVDFSNLAWPLLALILLGFIAHWLPDGAWQTAQRGFTRLPAPAQAVLLFSLSIGLYFVASSDVVPFIYTRF